MSRAKYLDKYKFTKRELEILELISKGCTNRQIANKFFVTLNTVETHINNIYHKTGLFLESEKQYSVMRVRLVLIYLGLYEGIKEGLNYDWPTRHIIYINNSLDFD